VTNDARVVVLAHARSGSNSLVEVLDRHPALSFINEPFNENFATWGADNPDYVARLRSGEAFDVIVDELFAQYTAMKELTSQLDDDCLDRLVRRPNVRVITLRRRNQLQTAVSQVIAEHTGLWKTWDATQPLDEHYRELPPLDLDLIANRMQWTAGDIARVDRAVGGVDPSRVFRVAYEDVYLAPPSRQRSLLDELWSFLDLPACEDPEIDHFLSDAVRQARPSTYGQAPNLAEIEARFGNDVTGHLEPWAAR